MRGYFFKKQKKDELTVMLIPSNLAVYEKSEDLEVSFDPNILEDSNIALIKDKEEGNLERDLQSGRAQMIDVDDNFLRDFRNLVLKNETKKAYKKALELYGFVKSVNIL